MNTGVVKFFNESKGYGFIIPDDPRDVEIFFHCSKVKGKISNASKVQYEIEMNKKGPSAVNVTPA
jgi:CspA family cold shock protein